MLAAALGASALSTVVFILAPNVEMLMAARILSGLSAGLMTGTATAALTELIPGPASRRASLVATAVNMGGLGLGPLIAGLFAQYAPHPTILVFEVYLAVLAAAGLCLLFVPETVSPRQRPVLRFAGLGIPEQGRGEFIAAGTAGFAAFSLLGLFSALAPTFLGSVMHESSHAVQGAVVFLMFAAGTVTQLLAFPAGSRRVVLAGLGLFLAALALIVSALAEAALALFLAGTVVGGVAVGAIFLGSLATANRLAPPERRGQAISAFFVACYAGLIIPVVGVGVLSGFTGTFPAVLAFSLLLAALCLFSLPLGSPRPFHRCRLELSADCSQRRADGGDDYPAERYGDERADEAGAETAGGARRASPARRSSPRPRAAPRHGTGGSGTAACAGRRRGTCRSR